VNPIFCRRFPKAIVVRGCSAGPCPEQAVGTGSRGAGLQTVTPATLTTAATTKEARYKNLDLPPSAGPQEQTETSGGEEQNAKR